MIFNGFIEKLQDEISSFLTVTAFPHPFGEEMIFPLPSKKNHFIPWAVEISFLHSKGCVNSPLIKIGLIFNNIL